MLIGRTLNASVRAVASKRRLIPQKRAIVLTNAALNKTKAMLASRPDAIGLKIGVKTKGCNGLSYTLDYATDKAKFDVEEIQDGVRIIIDQKAQLSVLGTEMDYTENKLQSEFIFNNPNITGTCGCGESFNIDLSLYKTKPK